MTHVTCKLTAKNRDRLRNPTLGNRVWATFTFIICTALVLCMDHATRGARVNTDTLRLAAAASATWAGFQNSVVHYATDRCRKRLEACINAEGGHSEHLL